MELLQGKYQELHVGDVRFAVVVRCQAEVLCYVVCWLSKAGVQRGGLETDICELSAYWCLLNYEMIQSRTAYTLEFSFLSITFQSPLRFFS